MDALLGERLNSEPVVSRGYTDSELLLAIIVSAAVRFPLALVVGFLVDSVIMALGFAMLAVLGSVARSALLYQCWKRGRPDYCLQQRVWLWLADAGLVKTGLVRLHGVMALGRALLMQYCSENENLHSHIKTLRAVALAELLLLAALWRGWESARGGLRTHILPDLRSGAVVRADDPQPGHVYAFARTIFQSIHYWPQDGQADYGKNLFTATYYLTPDFLAQLTADMGAQGRAVELAGRVRSLQEIPDHGYQEASIKPLGNSTWAVTLDFQVYEYVRGVPVKTVAVTYPLRVVRRDSDPTQNLWGLALDGYAGDGPRRLEPAETISAASPTPLSPPQPK